MLRSAFKILSFQIVGCDKNRPILRLARGTGWVSSYHGKGDSVQPDLFRSVRTIINVGSGNVKPRLPSKRANAPSSNINIDYVYFVEGVYFYKSRMDSQPHPLKSTSSMTRAVSLRRIILLGHMPRLKPGL